MTTQHASLLCLSGRDRLKPPLTFPSLSLSPLPLFLLQSLWQTHAGQPGASEEEQRQDEEDQPQAAGCQEQMKRRRRGTLTPLEQITACAFLFVFTVI